MGEEKSVLGEIIMERAKRRAEIADAVIGILKQIREKGLKEVDLGKIDEAIKMISELRRERVGRYVEAIETLLGAGREIELRFEGLKLDGTIKLVYSRKK